MAWCLDSAASQDTTDMDIIERIKAAIAGDWLFPWVQKLEYSLLNVGI